MEETDIKEIEKAVAGQCGRWTGNKYIQLKEFCGPNRMEEKIVEWSSAVTNPC